MINVEVCVRHGCGITRRDLRASIIDFLRFQTPAQGLVPGLVPCARFPAQLEPVIEHMLIDIDDYTGTPVPLTPVTPLALHIFALSDEAVDEAVIGADAGEAVAAARILELPHRSLANAWDSLFYETGIKGRMLSYATGILRLAQMGVPADALPASRLALLHGPPGSGKTSLARATAQKLSIRLQAAFPSAVLVEINSHSLFSRWFSESGKLVAALFAQVREILDEGVLCVVLIDEVESLAASRAAAAASGEPGDAVRAVNALITQLDTLRPYPNALILCTSNMAASVDPALVDRADLSIEVPAPGTAAAAALVGRITDQLVARGVLGHGVDVQAIAQVGAGLSGRALARLPLLALVGGRLAGAEYPISGVEFTEEAVRAAQQSREEAMAALKTHI